MVASPGPVATTSPRAANLLRGSSFEGASRRFPCIWLLATAIAERISAIRSLQRCLLLLLIYALLRCLRQRFQLPDFAPMVGMPVSPHVALQAWAERTKQQRRLMTMPHVHRHMHQVVAPAPARSGLEYIFFALQIIFTQLPAEAAVQSLLPGYAWGGEGSGGGGSGGRNSGSAAAGEEGAEAGALGALLLALGRAAWFVGGAACAIR